MTAGDLPMRGSRSALALALILLASCDDPAAIEPVDPEIVSAELAVQCPTPGTPELDQPFDALVWNGTHHVVAWTRRTVEAVDSERSQIVIARVTPDAEVLEPLGVAVTTEPGDYSAPRLAAAPDGEILVAFQDTASTADNQPLRVARVAADGTVRDPGGVVIAEGHLVAALTYGGADTWLIAWRRELADGSYQLRAARLSRDLAVLDGDGVVLPTGASAEWDEIAAASSGNDFLLAWPEASGDLGGAVLRSASFADPEAVTLTSSVRRDHHPALVSNGDGYALAWLAQTTQANDVLEVALVSVDGVVGTTRSEPFTAAAATTRLSIAHAGGTYLVSYDDVRSQLYGADLAPLAAPVIRPSRLAARPRVSSDGTAFLVVWDGTAMDAARILADGTVLDPAHVETEPGTGWQTWVPAGFTIVGAAASQRRSAVAWLPAGPFFVWGVGGVEYSGRMGRLSVDGDIVDIPAPGPFGRPAAIARAGDDAILVSSSGTALRVSADGDVLDAEPLDVINRPEWGRPSVACGAGDCLVAWLVDQDEKNVRAGRLSNDGAILDPFGIDLALGVDARSGPDVASDGAGYLVVWEQRLDGVSDVRAARISSAGAVLDPGGVVVGEPVDEWQASGSAPAVALSGSSYLVVWYALGEVRGRLIDAATGDLIGDQVVLGRGRGVAPFGDPESHLDVAASADGFVVAWETSLSVEPAGIVAIRVGFDGVPIDPEPFLVAPGGVAPSLAGADDGSVVVSYTRFVPEPPFMSSRIRARYIGRDPGPQPQGCP